MRRKCQQSDLNNQAIYNQSTVSSSGGYATTKPHTRSSWTCTYKAGRQHQAETHIWETPLPKPSADEYTLPTNMRQHHNIGPIPTAMLDSMEYTVPISTTNTHGVDSIPQTEYTKPLKNSNQRDGSTRHPLPATDAGNISQLDKRHSQANYYYYDPSSGEQSEYMAPTSSGNKNLISAEYEQTTLAENHHDVSDGIPVNVPVQETNKECAYRTLIRLDNSSIP